jgi:dissimilatory sulfite reductase (desulfoviridin) alpha/beta subunit
MADEKVDKPTKPEDFKAIGFIPQRQKNTFTVRLRVPGGRLQADKLIKMAHLAKKYGSGDIHVSVRQSVELLYVPLDKKEALEKEMKELGVELASCGRRVRVPTACGGCEYNPRGWTDTVSISKTIDDKFFMHPMPHKFKIGVTGCPIDCMRTREMDLGFQGVAEPKLIPDKCTGCTLCVRACQDQALHMDAEGKLPVRIWENCTSCGDCIRVCPVDAMVVARVGHIVNVGGKHGKHPRAATPVAKFLPDEKIFEVIEKTIQWYEKHGKKGERIGSTFDRVGLNNYREFMKDAFGEHALSDEDLKKPGIRHTFWSNTWWIDKK